MNRDDLARQALGHFTLKTASDVRDGRDPTRTRVATWLYSSTQAMLLVSDGLPLPHFVGTEYLNDYCILMKYVGQAHQLTAPPLVPNGIIEFSNAMTIAGPKKYIKTVSQLIRQSAS